MTQISKKDVSVGRGTFVATASGTVTLGDLVAYKVDASGEARYYTVIAADFNSSPIQNCIAGVALETAASGAEVAVQFWGFCPAVKSGTVTAGDRLCLDTAGTAGKVITAVTPDDGTAADPVHQILGVATAGDSGGFVAAFLSIPRHQ